MVADPRLRADADVSTTSVSPCIENMRVSPPASVVVVATMLFAGRHGSDRLTEAVTAIRVLCRAYRDRAGIIELV
jgi:hypothetical protein